MKTFNRTSCRMLYLAYALGLCITVVCPMISYSQVVLDKTITYQGSVHTSTGAPLSGSHQLTVTLYEDQFGRNPVWAGNYTPNIDNGIFTVALGSGEYPLPQQQDLSRPLWIGLRIDNGEELRPLTILSGAPYALTVSDKSITKEKLQADYVGSISINGEKVTGNGTSLNIKSGAGVDLLYDKSNHSLSFNSINGIGIDAKRQFIANGTNNDDGSPFNTISGGMNNTTILPGAPMSWFSTVGGGFSNTANDNYSVVAGGNTNTGTAPFTAIVGGGFNTASGCAAFVGGGGTDCDSNLKGNTAAAVASAVVGGQLNAIVSGSDVAFIGGGDNNTIWDGKNATITGGTSNNIGSTGNSDEGFIGGGNGNSITNTDDAVIGGGFANGVEDLSNNSTIAGGNANTIDTAAYSIIGGGQGNVISEENGLTHSGILGGHHNQIHSSFAVIGGGEDNIIPTGSDYATIAGGSTNTASATSSAVGGGSNNVAASINSFVGGGSNNIIPAGSNNAAIGGGADNTTLNNHSTVGGGLRNQATGLRSTVGGGNDNIASGSSSFVGGGDGNTAAVSTSAIAGGDGNTANGQNSFIGGGLTNTATPSNSVIGGGKNNTVGAGATSGLVVGGESNTANGIESAVLNGDNNFVIDYAQSAVGYFNHVRKTCAPADFPLTAADAYNAQIAGFHLPYDDYNTALFMVGNGSTTQRHNAMEVSYNGHITAFDMNRHGIVPCIGDNPMHAEGRSVKVGAHYRDNMVSAWGLVDAPGTITDNNNFGVAKIEHVPGSGCYTVWLNISDSTCAEKYLRGASITATIADNNCDTNGHIISVSQIQWGLYPCTPTDPLLGNNFNYFTVHICEYFLTGPASPKLSKRMVDDSFMFKVVGRPID